MSGAEGEVCLGQRERCSGRDRRGRGGTAVGGLSRDSPTQH